MLRKGKKNQAESLVSLGKKKNKAQARRGRGSESSK